VQESLPPKSRFAASKKNGWKCVPVVRFIHLQGRAGIAAPAMFYTLLAAIPNGCCQMPNAMKKTCG